MNGRETDGGRPLVSVVTVYHNRAAYVAESVGSLLAQTYPHLEIIVVDDGSTDDTLARLRAFDDPRLRIIDKPNTGFTSSVNLGVRESRGELVAIHGAGDLSHPRRIELQAERMRARPDIGIVGCRVRNAQVGSDAFTTTKAHSDEDLTAQLLRDNPFTHGEVMFRRALFDRVGGYREFFRFAQDLDLWLRLSGFCRHEVLEEVLYTRLSHEGGVRSSPDKVLLQHRLAELARQSREAVDAGGRDLIEQHGDLAPARMRRSRRLAEKLVSDGLNRMLHADPADGWALVQAGYDEHKSPKVRLLHALLATHRAPVIFSTVVRPALRGWKQRRP